MPDTTPPATGHSTGFTEAKCPGMFATGTDIMRRARMRQLGAVIFIVVAITESVNLGHAQSVRDAGHFWAMSQEAGTVQFLPGGVVLKREDGKNTFYSYRAGGFAAIRSENISTAMGDWVYFDWDSIDYQDQLDRGTFDIPRDKFLPGGAKVKKVIYVPTKNAPEVIALVCYTVPVPEGENPIPGADYIFLLVLRGERKDAGYSYKQILTQKLQKDSNYGDLILQNVSGIGKVLALYSVAPGGSSEDRQLDLYLLGGFPG